MRPQHGKKLSTEKITLHKMKGSDCRQTIRNLEVEGSERYYAASQTNRAK